MKEISEIILNYGAARIGKLFIDLVALAEKLPKDQFKDAAHEKAKDAVAEIIKMSQAGSP